MIQNYWIDYDISIEKFPSSLKRRGLDRTESFENYKDECKRALFMIFGIKKKNVWIRLGTNKREQLSIYNESGTCIEGKVLSDIQDIFEKIYEIGVFWSASTDAEEDDE